MNSRIKEFISNFSITLTANMLSMAVSSLAVLLLPALIDVKEYGYWQLYVFYCSYTAYFSFGITDGVYIRNGGKKYEDLDTDIIRPQYWVLVLINVLLTISVTFIFLWQSSDMNKVLIAFLACCSAIIIIPRSLLTMTMLSVNRIKENAVVLMIDRAIYLVILMLFCILKLQNFYFLILGDLLGQLISGIFAVYRCRALVFGRLVVSIRRILQECKTNISVGIKIVIAGLAGMLIVGIVRMGIEQHWGVEEFAKVSLSLSVCNMLLIFIKAISVVIFPVLCNSSKESLKKIYAASRDSLGIILLGAIVFYYPIKSVLSFLLPQYSESLSYMAFLFPISLYECKTQLLLNTYFKAMRKEKLLLTVNVLTVILSLLLSTVTIKLFHSIHLAIFSIVILLAYRCYLSEFLLLHFLEIRGYKDIALEIAASFLFIWIHWYIGGYMGMFLYFLVYLFYIFMKREQFMDILRNVKALLFQIQRN